MVTGLVLTDKVQAEEMEVTTLESFSSFTVKDRIHRALSHGNQQFSESSCFTSLGPAVGMV